jgi:hypothetical protein
VIIRALPAILGLDRHYNACQRLEKQYDAKADTGWRDLPNSAMLEKS